MPPLPTHGKSILMAAESCNATAQCRREARLAEERDAAGQVLGGGGDCRIGAAVCFLVCSLKIPSFHLTMLHSNCRV